MRAIDADALKEHFQSLAYDDWNQGVSTSWADAYRECADMVDDMPTVQPDHLREPTKMMERKTGRWIHRGCGCFECDKCGERVTLNAYTAEKASDRFRFCYHCGVRMMEDEG